MTITNEFFELGRKIGFTRKLTKEEHKKWFETGNLPEGVKGETAIRIGEKLGINQKEFPALMG